MDAGDRADARLRLHQGRMRSGIGDGRGLQPDQRGDERERVADAVVDLAQQHLGAVARLADVLLRGGRFPGERRLRHRAFQSGMQELEELFAGVLRHIIGCAGLECRDRHAEIAGPGHVDDRRRILQRSELLKEVQAGAAGHVMIEADRVDAALLQALERRGGVWRMLDDKSPAMQDFLDEAGETGVVIDVKDADVPFCHQIGSGTCMTEKNSPSWRIALAKPS
jgi:hypothetical protein